MRNTPRVLRTSLRNLRLSSPTTTVSINPDSTDVADQISTQDSAFMPERLEFPELSPPPPPPLSDLESVVSYTPASNLLAAIPNDGILRQVNLPKIQLLPMDASKALIAQWVALVNDPHMHHSHLLYLSLDMMSLLDIKFAAYFETHPLETCCAYTELSKKEFCRILTIVYSDVVVGVAVNLPLHRRIKDMDIVKFDLSNQTVENLTVVNLLTVCKHFVDVSGQSNISPQMHLACVKVLNNLLPQFPIDWRLIVDASNALTIKAWLTAFVNALNTARTARSKAAMYGFVVSNGEGTVFNGRASLTNKRVSSASSVSASMPIAKKAKPSLQPRSLCTGCGNPHDIRDCLFTNHPDFNRSATAWQLSANGMAWQAKGKNTLPARMTLSGAPSNFVDRPSARVPVASASHPSVRPGAVPPSSSVMKGKSFHARYIMENDLASTLSSLSPSNINLLPCTISVSSQETNLAGSKKFKVSALLDTGSLAGDFISQQLVEKFRFLSTRVPVPNSVCSGLNNTCVDLNQTVSLTVSFTNEVNNKIFSFSINAFILKDTPIDFIVGLATIKRYNLFSAVPSLVSETSHNVRSCTDCTKKEPALPKDFINFEDATPLTVDSSLHASLLESADRVFGQPVEDLNQIPQKVDSFEPWLTDQFPSEDPLSQINISGSNEFRSQIIALCSEFRHLFCQKLPPTPALLKPFDIVVDESKWERPCNRTAPRRMAPKAQLEVQRQISEMLAAGIITDGSKATHYSQVLLVPKPGVDKFRMCIDYRNLNDCTKDASYPIPNIDQMFRRIGLKKPQFWVHGPNYWVPPSFSFFILPCIYSIYTVLWFIRVYPSSFRPQKSTILLTGTNGDSFGGTHILRV